MIQFLKFAIHTKRMVMANFENFTNLYSISKTLRFELRPIGKTQDFIEKHGLLKEDARRADSYKKVKKLIDEYHKDFIEKSLSSCKLKIESNDKKDSLEEYCELYKKKDKSESDKKAFKKIQDQLRSQIVKAFNDREEFKELGKKELITDLLPKFLDNENNKELVEEFKTFTTYFTGFHENRKNMYSSEEKSTAIAYRLIHENLPKHLDNVSIFEKLKTSKVSEEFANISKDLKEELQGKSLEDLFLTESYIELLSQSQIDRYNALIGGKSLEKNKKIKGLNEYINLYNQKQKDSKDRLPKLKMLYKQILSDRGALSWLPETFSSDNELLEKIEECRREFTTNEDGKGSLLEKIKQLIISLDKYDVNKIYIRNDIQITNISQKVFGSYGIIYAGLRELLKKDVKQKKKENIEDYEERLEKLIKALDSIAISTIEEGVASLGLENKSSIVDYFKQNIETLFVDIENNYSKVKDLLNIEYFKECNLKQDKVNVEKIKNYLDSLKALQNYIKPLCGKGNEAEKDEKFYGDFTQLWDEFNKITQLYNMVRNYLTQKPYSEEKIKLNFQNSTLLKGWDLNKERDNTSVLLRKDGLYYLAIMNKNHNAVFDVKNTKDKNNGECYEKIEYKLLPGPNKMLPKVFLSTKGIAEFNPSNELLKNYQNETHKKGDKFKIEDCHALIDFFKTSIEKHKDWKHFGFVFSDTKSYEDLSGFYKEVEHQGYKITFRNIAVDYIDSLVEEGKIYLFQIYNKDFSPHSKGTPNLHTLYWKMLFEGDNLSNVVYKLNGEAEVFFRKKSLPNDKPTHPANEPIEHKNKLSGDYKSVFPYDLIKDKRYTVNKYQFHVPITINFKSENIDNVNDRVNQYIRESKDLHIIGIDRGERHLLYISVVDLQGNIKYQTSLNVINNYDYHDKLTEREKERDEERKSWQTIEGIKDLKEGYLSQAIHKICNLMIEYNAIVVLEDLNFGFMRGRQKFEHSVYQKFEKMLIDKLNYLADKKKKTQEIGGLLKAYQLTNQFKSFKELGKQSGFLFYTQAWNTSKIDPVTGFVNLFDARYTNKENARKFFSNFEDIRFNKEKNYFEFEFDYNNFTTKAEETRTKWTLCTFGERIETFRNSEKNSQWDNKTIDLTNSFKELFEKYGINYSDLKEQIVNQEKKEFFEELLHLLRLTLQMRNSISNTDVDYIISPVADEEGNFYLSSKCDESLPQDADANGAYNIARKGIMIVERIKASKKGEKLDLSISNKDWLKFAQNKPYRK